MKIRFGTLQLCRCFERLGFTPDKQYGSSHQKWRAPKSCTVPAGIRPFITVVHGRKEYFTPTIVGYMRQLRQFGFTQEQIIKALTK